MRHLKFHEPPRTRVRVHELARQVGLPPKDLLAMLRDDLREYVASANSLVEVPVIRRVHEQLGITYTIERQSRPAEAPVLLFGLGPPVKQPKRDNNPLMNPAERPRDLLDDHRPDWRRFDAPPQQSKTSSDSEHDEWARARIEASPAFEYEEWIVRGFNESERLVWMDAGFAINQASAAEMWRNAGLRPVDLDKPAYGWTARERIRKGESAKSVARKLIQQEETG